MSLTKNAAARLRTSDVYRDDMAAAALEQMAKELS